MGQKFDGEGEFYRQEKLRAYHDGQRRKHHGWSKGLGHPGICEKCDKNTYALCA